MAICRPGTGATITAPTQEAQLGHSFYLLNFYQSIPANNIGEVDYVQADIDLEEMTFTGSFDLPCTREYVNGKPTFTVTEYLQNVPFTPGNPSGSFGSSSLPSYFLEILTFMQGVESFPQFNPAEVNNLSGTYDTDTAIFSGQLTLPIEVIMNPSGVLGVYFKEYLLHPGT